MAPACYTGSETLMTVRVITYRVMQRSHLLSASNMGTIAQSSYCIKTFSCYLKVGLSLPVIFGVLIIQNVQADPKHAAFFVESLRAIIPQKRHSVLGSLTQR